MAARSTGALTEIGDGLHVWLPPDGSWGWSNAGLVTDGSESMIVDTLFDLVTTATMLEEMQRVAPDISHHVDVLVNTHANGDHCHGNELVPTKRIIASTAAAAEMHELPPENLAALMEIFAEDQSALGRYLRLAFGSFEFGGITFTPPTETFDRSLSVTVGDLDVELIEVGPAHTAGDVLVHVPARNVVFTGDILFIEGTPIIWAGPVGNWIGACDRIAAMDAVTVPGHGPITDGAGVAAVRDYLTHIRDEARVRFDGGMSVDDAVRDIDLGPFADWSEPERLFIIMTSLYREFGSTDVATDVAALFTGMATVWDETHAP